MYDKKEMEELLKRGENNCNQTEARGKRSDIIVDQFRGLSSNELWKMLEEKRYEAKQEIIKEEMIRAIARENNITVEDVLNAEPTVGELIKIKYFTDEIERLCYIDGKSDWIDLRAAKEVKMKAGEFQLIPLGIAMELPKGYEAHVVPRSSTFKNYGVIETNGMGIIDESYCGDNDQWFFPAYALRDTVIHVNDRICQFRIMEHQPALIFDEVWELKNEDRGGHGSTGKQ